MALAAKPNLSPPQVSELLRSAHPDPVTRLESLPEGEDSQVFRFEARDQWYVLRIRSSREGFLKDAYAAAHFASAALAIPPVHRIGTVGDKLAYCISAYVPGTTLQDLEARDLDATLPHVLALHETLAQVNICDTTGYGVFDTHGTGPAPSWAAWLVTTVAGPEVNWAAVLDGGAVPVRLIREAEDHFRGLVDRVPTERNLFHGDFGSNNLLARDHQVVGVLDWDRAGYGDWLFDVAAAYYWRPHLLCMDRAAQAYERHWAHLPRYRVRIQCYQLRLALGEIYAQAQTCQGPWLDWHLRRCQDILMDVHSM